MTNVREANKFKHNRSFIIIIIIIIIITCYCLYAGYLQLHNSIKSCF